MSLTIEAECPACTEPEDKSLIDVVFDPAQEVNELDCPFCGALLQVAEYDAAAGTVTLIEVEEEEEESDAEAEQEPTPFEQYADDEDEDENDPSN